VNCLEAIVVVNISSQCYWSLQNGNGTVSWDDAELTPKGLQQAENAKKFWINTRNTDKVPFPQFFFVSPLRRTLQTATITFQEHLSKINESMFADPQRRAPGYRVTIPELWAWEVSCTYA
jgi:broad specificity phosphatase PhoE